MRTQINTEYRPAYLPGATVAKDEMSLYSGLGGWMTLQRVCSIKTSCGRARSAVCSAEPEHVDKREGISKMDMFSKYIVTQKCC